MLTVEFAKMYYSRQRQPTFLFEQQIRALEAVCDASFLSTALELHSEVTILKTTGNVAHVNIRTLLTMTDTIISRNIDSSSWCTLYWLKYVIRCFEYTADLCSR
jgi:hypothetical protein